MIGVLRNDQQPFWPLYVPQVYIVFYAVLTRHSVIDVTTRDSTASDRTRLQLQHIASYLTHCCAAYTNRKHRTSCKYAVVASTVSRRMTVPVC